MKKKLFLFAAMLCLTQVAVAKIDTLRVCSPDGSLVAKVWMAPKLQLSLWVDGREVMTATEIDLQFTNGLAINQNNSIKSSKKRSIRELIESPVPEKRRMIPDHYQELSIQFKQPFRLLVRAYDDGFAYRIESQIRDSVVIEKEVGRYRFAPNSKAYFPVSTIRAGLDRFHTSFETPYLHQSLTALSKDSMAYVPVVVTPIRTPKIAILESDLEDYPGMHLLGTGTDELETIFAGYPLEEMVSEGEFPQISVKKRAAYIARTTGKRSYPWRIFVVAREDKYLASNDLAYRLASPSRIADPSWITPGKSTEEWIISSNLFHVPFKAGVNTNSYKYYIDFAARFGLSHLFMDAGWSNTMDITEINPEIDMDEIARYAREKGVKLGLWTLSMTLERQHSVAFEMFKRWNVTFIMIDFLDRDDQKMVQFYHNLSKLCADNHISPIFHGAYPPKGFTRTYPNNIAREGVMGSEYNIWSAWVTPEHDVTIPFTRGIAGTMDYEPGFLFNATQQGYRYGTDTPMSMGTRTHQLAMFLSYDAPMQFFSGNPSQGNMEPEFMQFLGSFPTTWDETIILDGSIGEFILTARRHGDDWYIAGMTNWEEREVNIPLHFLGNGTYRMTLCKDGINANKYPADYQFERTNQQRANTLKIKMAKGGGFALSLKQ